MNLEDNYDSDTIDEDLEANLYASVYFDNTVEQSSEAALQTPNHKFADQDSQRADSLSKNVTSTPMPPQGTFIDSPASIFPESFTWSFPPELEKTVTSLSLVADAIYLNLTGQLPPSVKQSFAQKCGRSLGHSFSMAAPPTPLSSSKIINGSPSDTNPSFSRSKRVSFHMASSSDEDSDEKEDLQSDPDTSDIILGVSNMSRNVFSASNDDVTEISRLLKRSRSEPAFWQLDRDDLRQGQFRNSRYYDDTGTCSICFKKGHNARQCSRTGPVCILCGVDGHFANSCPAQYCSSCLMQGHTQANCHLRGRLRQDGQSEHQNCGGILQRFRLTDKKRDPMKGFKPPKSCCFCGRRGHVFEECRSRQSHRGNSRREMQKATLARLASSMTPVTKRSDLGGRLYRQNRMARSLDPGGGLASRFALDSDDEDGSDVDPRTRKRIERATNRVERKLFEKALKRTLGQKSKAKKKDTSVSNSSGRGASSARGVRTMNHFVETSSRNPITSPPFSATSFVPFASTNGPSAKRARKNSNSTRIPAMQVNGISKKKKTPKIRLTPAFQKSRLNKSTSALDDHRNPVFNPDWTFEESEGGDSNRRRSWVAPPAATEVQSASRVPQAVEEEEWYRKTVRLRRIPSWGGAARSSPSPRGGGRRGNSQSRRGWAPSARRGRTASANRGRAAQIVDIGAIQ